MDRIQPVFLDSFPLCLLAENERKESMKDNSL